ncbi:MAG: flagellar hook-associated protein FlgL [Deltaproteobacteria bacterium]|jgi:flagellar hook-associated protein 3 FlgL|nr:flagellar hook-associated protein FlgL [Deltaproteobacteria bacterium]
MALRISQRQMYTTMVYGMNSNLSSLMDLHAQNTTQKKVNKPSDDPYGSAQILQSHNTLAAITQYQDNLNMAKGWLNTADGVLEQVQEQLVELQGILQQGANGTLNDEQRKNLAFKARGILDQLINLANTKFSDRHVFAGHKTDQPAYARSLSVTTRDANIADVDFKISGNTDHSIVVQFTSGGYVSDTPPPAFRYSDDAGATWKTGSWTNNGVNNVMDCGGVQMEAFVNGSAELVTSVDPNLEYENNNGTWLYIKPTAVYLGDTNDTQVVQLYPAAGSTGTGSVKGAFSQDVAVRLDEASGAEARYSYSLDNGRTWTSATVNYSGAGPVDLVLPGGVLSLNNPNFPTPPDPGEQYMIKPYRADITLNIGSNASIVVNNVGKDVFGGIYEAPFSQEGAQPASGINMFEVVGEAIAFFESNGQQGCQETLAKLEKVMEHVVGYRTQNGAKVNQTSSIEKQLEYLQYDEEGRLSTIEDADLSELLTKLSQQQLAYNTVLKSSSMIMQLSLVNFL